MTQHDSILRKPRPKSFVPSDDMEWQNGKWRYFVQPSPSTRSFAISDGSDLASTPLAPNRWSRGVHGNHYAAVEVQQGASAQDRDTKIDKTASAKTFELNSLRSYTEIFPSDGLPDGPREKPKKAIKRGLRANWAKLVPHVIAVLVTIGVCQLSFRDAYWMDLRPPNEPVAFGLTQGGALNFLQLAAKLHELLILASISALVLHSVQVHLTGRSGLPLGMIANAFDLSSAQFLRRKSFWAMIWSVDPITGKAFPYMRFWFLSLLSTILVTLAGPSSAIAVIPTLNYFDLAKPYHGPPMFPYYVWNASTELWPAELTAASLNAPNSGIDCLDPDSTRTEEICPAGGFRDTYNWVGGLLFSDTDTGTNISFPDATGATRRVLSSRSCNSTFDGRASAVSINSFISGALTSYWIFAQHNFEGIALEAAQPHINIDPNTEIFAPRVEAMCTSYSNYHFDPENPDNQTTMFFPTFGGANPIQVPEWTYKYSRPQNASNFTFVEIPRTGPDSPSLGAVLTLPLIENNGTWFQTTENLACSIYSSWIPADAWYEPTINDQVSFDIKAPMGDTCLNLPINPSSGRQSIKTTIDLEYANAINAPIEFVTGPTPALLGMFQRYVFNDSVYIPDGVIFKSPIPGVAGVVVTDDIARKARAKLVSTVLAGVVTDGLARNVGDGSFPYSAPFFLLPNKTADGSLQGRFVFTSATGGQDEPLNTTNVEDTSTWLRLNPSIQRYGYGYHWRGSRTTQFGISVLLIHIVVALAHMTYVLREILVKDRGLPGAWSTIPEFFALAVNSRPSEKLQNTCAGIDESKTWSEPVAVREASEGHLEMVLGRSQMVQMPVARGGVRYGALPAI